MLSEQTLALVNTIAELGSFSAAANALHKVPSAVSHTIKQLEESLGVILFERNHHSVSLTAAGEHFVTEAHVMLQQIEKVKKETLRIGNGWEPSLSIAIDVIVCTDRIHELITDFYHHFNDVELSIHMEVFNGVWESLATEESDIAIGATTAVPIEGAFQCKDMGSIEWSFVVGKEHPLASVNVPLCNEELAQFPFICLEDTSKQIPRRNTWVIPNQPQLVVPNWAYAINCASAGVGIGYLPKHIANPSILSGSLIEKRIENAKNPSPCCLAWNTQKTSPALDWVLDYLGDSKKLNREWIS